MKTIFALLFSCLLLSARAQTGYNYYEAIAGIDLQHYNGNNVIGFDLGYNGNPYLPVTLQIETGIHTSVILKADYQFGNFLNTDNILKNVYIGTGFGGCKTSLLVPLRCGYEFKINDQYQEPAEAITIGYVHIIGLNQNRFQIAFKYFLGHLKSYKKLI